MSVFDENDGQGLGTGGALLMLAMLLGGGLVRAALTWPAYTLAGLLRRTLLAVAPVRAR
jgi:hypothetical protein